MQKILFALGFGTACSLMGDATLYAVLPTHIAEAGITLGLVGILLGVNRAVRLVFNGIAGWLYDHISQRLLFLVGLGIGAFSTLCYAFAPGFWLLLSGRVFWGMAWSLIWIGGGTILLNVTSESERGRRTGLYQTWFFAGAGAGALLGGVLTDVTGYRTAMGILASLQAVSAVTVIFLFPPMDKNVPPHPPNPLEKPSGGFFSRDLCLTATLQGINRFCLAGILHATLGLLVMERIMSPHFLIGVATMTGLLIAARTVIGMSAAPLAGYVSDIIGSRWRVISWMLLLGVVTMFSLATGHVLFIISGILLSAILSSTLQSLTITLTGDIVAADRRGQAISFLHTAGDLGSALGPPCAYALLSYFGLERIYLCCAGLFFLSWLLLFFAART